MATTEEPRVVIAIGTAVDVFSRFRQEWVGGFEVAAVRDHGYSIRRRLDWAVLPGVFGPDDVRLTRR
jgi:hypothetical protein